MSTVVTKQQSRKTVAANLQQAMDERGVTQADCARAIKAPTEKLQAARQRMSRYCNAESDIVGDDLANLSEFLEESADWILTHSRNRKSRHAG